jgi:hypothetical protein
LEIGLLNTLGDATYYAGDVAGALTPYRSADAIADREIGLRGETPSLSLSKAAAAWNLSGTLGELGREQEALALVVSGRARLERLLRAGSDSSGEKLLLVLYGQEAVILEAQGKLAEALAVARLGNAIRERRLTASPAHYQAIRDVAIGLLQSGRLEGLLGPNAAACATAGRARNLFDQLRAMKALSTFDASNEAPKAAALITTYCR